MSNAIFIKIKNFKTNIPCDIIITIKISIISTFAILSLLVSYREIANKYIIQSAQSNEYSFQTEAVQQKLHELGFYNGSTDGKVNLELSAAIRNYQLSMGIDGNGSLDTQTINLLEIKNINTNEINSNVKGNNTDICLLAKIINAQVGEESYICKVAFGAMILNRVESPDYPDNLSSVIYQSGAFDVLDDPVFALEPSQRAVRAARAAFGGIDPSGGATGFFLSEDKRMQEQNKGSIIVTLGKYCFYN